MAKILKNQQRKTGGDTRDRLRRKLEERKAQEAQEAQEAQNKNN